MSFSDVMMIILMLAVMLGMFYASINPRRRENIQKLCLCGKYAHTYRSMEDDLVSSYAHPHSTARSSSNTLGTLPLPQLIADESQDEYVPQHQ